MWSYVRWLLWIAYQVAVATAVFWFIEARNPDAAKSAIGVISFMAALWATLIPTIIMELVVRRRSRLATDKRLGNPVKVIRGKPSGLRAKW